MSGNEGRIVHWLARRGPAGKPRSVGRLLVGASASPKTCRWYRGESPRCSQASREGDGRYGQIVRYTYLLLFSTPVRVEGVAPLRPGIVFAIAISGMIDGINLQ